MTYTLLLTYLLTYFGCGFWRKRGKDRELLCRFVFIITSVMWIIS